MLLHCPSEGSLEQKPPEKLSMRLYPPPNILFIFPENIVLKLQNKNTGSITSCVNLNVKPTMSTLILSHEADNIANAIKNFVSDIFFVNMTILKTLPKNITSGLNYIIPIFQAQNIFLMASCVIIHNTNFAPHIIPNAI